MTLPEQDVERIVRAVETIEVSLSVLAAKQALFREAYLADRESRDVVERRFVKLTEATLDIANNSRVVNFTQMALLRPNA